MASILQDIIVEVPINWELRMHRQNVIKENKHMLEGIRIMYMKISNISSRNESEALRRILGIFNEATRR